MAKKTEIKTERIEREYVIPLRERMRPTTIHKRSKKAIKIIKEFLVRHMKIRDGDLNKIKIDSYLNEVIWSRGIKNPPHKIKVKAIKEGGIVKVEAVELPNNLKFKKIREERIEAKASDTSKKKKAEKKEVEKTEEEKAEDTEKRVEEEEKKTAVVEAGNEMEKAAAKQMKHQVGGKTKEPKRQHRMALQK